jgi:hypothetical protein
MRGATQLIATTLGDLGLTDLTIQVDGPVAYPISERDAYLQHTDQVATSTAGWGGMPPDAPCTTSRVRVRSTVRGPEA